MTREEAMSKLNTLIRCVVDRAMIDEICHEVIEFLESQMPRVMTLDEIYACNEGDCLYYQCEGEFDGNVLYIWSEVGFYVDMRAAIHRFTCDPSLYGSMWRCWTSRPSAEVMASTPWEGDAE